MPFYLEASDVIPQVAGLRSVLIVPCGFCPAASFAVREKKAYMEVFRKLWKTEVYESFIRDLKHRMEQIGVKTGVFEIRLPHHYVACMWTHARRRELAKRSREFEGVVVLGCKATAEIVRDAIGSGGCRVIEGMEAQGIMNVVPTVRFPFNISLELQGITSVERISKKKIRVHGKARAGEKAQHTLSI